VLETKIEKLDNGRQLRVARLGSGPPLILLHGYPENLQIWSNLAPRLGSRFEVIAFDWPGMGYSQAWPGGASPFQMASRLVKLLDLWQIQRATLVALDMGGQPALVLAARNPDRVSGLVVTNSLVMWDEATSWEIKLLRKFQLNHFIIKHLPRIVFRRAEKTFLPPSVVLPEDVRQDFWSSFSQREVCSFISRMCAGYQGTLPRLPEFYSKVACPTLVLWGEKDRHFPPTHGERLHRLVANSSVEVIEGGEHWMVWHSSERVASSLERFFDARASS
jgi:pimeloyl-ACP methyl ester carboxylesterase